MDKGRKWKTKHDAGGQNFKIKQEIAKPKSQTVTEGEEKYIGPNLWARSCLLCVLYVYFILYEQSEANCRLHLYGKLG